MKFRFDILDDLSGKMPKLRQQIMRLMSSEIKSDQEMILLLSKMNAEERLAAFIHNLSNAILLVVSLRKNSV